MYCRYCGRKIESNVSCCPYCGKSAIGINESTKSQKKELLKKKKRKGPRIFLIVLFLLLLVCYEIFTLRVKENFADSITYNSRFTPENNVAEEKLIGYWTVDTEKTNNVNDVSLMIYFGSGIKCGYEMVLKEDGTASWYIGIGNGGEGTYIFSNSGGELKYLDYEDGLEKTVPLSVIEEAGVDYILMKYDNYTLYWVKSEENSTDIRRVSRINYYDFDGVLIYYDSYAYYDNGLLCSTTLHSVDYSASYIGNEYTILYLYDDEGNLTQTVLDAFTIGKWYDKDNGKITLGYVYDANGNSNKITICPERESIEQEKYGVDPNKTEKIYGSVPIISTDSSNGWASAYLDDIFDGDEPTDMTTCRFIYVDNNTQPELWLDYSYGCAGAEIYTASNGTTDNIYMSHGECYWIEGCNILLATGGHMDAHYDTIYQIQNGKFITTAMGDFGAKDNSNIQYDENYYPVYDYYWNNTKVTQSEYEQCLSDAFEMKSAMDIYQNIYTYNQCKLLLQVIVESST